MPSVRCAYLDIETTGLSPYDSELTVVGICVEQEQRHRVVQLVGDEITEQALWNVLDGIGRIYTYNGRRFDLPFIATRLGIDLAASIHHQDLIFDCWRNRLYGGFKSVERKLGIPRKTAGECKMQRSKCKMENPESYHKDTKARRGKDPSIESPKYRNRITTTTARQRKPETESV